MNRKAANSVIYEAGTNKCFVILLKTKFIQILALTLIIYSFNHQSVIAAVLYCESILLKKKVNMFN